MARRRLRILPQYGVERPGISSTPLSRRKIRISSAEHSAARSGKIAPSSSFPTKAAASGREFPARLVCSAHAGGTDGRLFGGHGPSLAASPISLRPSALDGRSGCDSALGLAQGGIDNAYVSGNYSSQIHCRGPRYSPQTSSPHIARIRLHRILLRFVPAANRPDGVSYQAVPVEPDTPGSIHVRFDHHINDHQNFSFYYYFTDDTQFSAFYDFQASGANIPGFRRNRRFALSAVQSQPHLDNQQLSHQRSPLHLHARRAVDLSASANHERGAVIMRLAGGRKQFVLTEPRIPRLHRHVASREPAPSTASPRDFPRTTPEFPSLASPAASLSATVGKANLPQVGNSFMWTDNLTWVKGNHTSKFGADVRRSRFDQTLYYNVSGQYTFNSSHGRILFSSTTTIPAIFSAWTTVTRKARRSEKTFATPVLYLFAQDSWKVKPNSHLNYGLRWEFDTPLTDALHHVQTFRPGQNSTVYPCVLTPTEQANLGGSDCTSAGVQPTGLVVPGDQGVPAGLTQTYYKAFAPRVGLAWSPSRERRIPRQSFWHPTARPAFAPVWACSTTRWSSWCSNSSVPSPPSAAALSSLQPS